MEKSCVLDASSLTVNRVSVRTNRAGPTAFGEFLGAFQTFSFGLRHYNRSRAFDHQSALSGRIEIVPPGLFFKSGSEF
jgi:hypothetical protein